MEKTIIIVGAGAAGLLAARELSKAGYKIIITEANNRVGGRIHTLSEGLFNFNVEAGAEFIHGRLPITLKLLREADIGYKRVEGEMYQAKQGKFNKQQEMAPHWDELIEKLETLKADMTIAAFLDQYFSDPKYHELRQSVQRFAEGFDVADITKASILAVREEWQEDMDDTFRITGGYGQLVDYLKNQCLAAGCELYTVFEVKMIEWKKDSVTVISSGGKKLQANKVIITIPLGLLEQGAVQFNPAIDSYMQAARQMGVGSVIKILFQFREAFWNRYADDIGFIFSEEIVPTWWTQSPDTNALLVGWFGGQQVLRVQGATEEEIAAIAIESLAKTCGLDPLYLKDLLIAQEVHDWSRKPYARSAYSYSTLLTDAARQVFNVPVVNTLFFAGEGYHKTESAGTVEAAFDSALQTVKAIK